MAMIDDKTHFLQQLDDIERQMNEIENRIIDWRKNKNYNDNTKTNMREEIVKELNNLQNQLIEINWSGNERERDLYISIMHDLYEDLKYHVVNISIVYMNSADADKLITIITK